MLEEAWDKANDVNDEDVRYYIYASEKNGDTITIPKEKFVQFIKEATLNMEQEMENLKNEIKNKILK